MVLEGPSMRTYLFLSGTKICLEKGGKASASHYTFVIYYLDNDCELIFVGTVGEEDDATDFDKPPLGGLNVDFSHRTGKAVDFNLAEFLCKPRSCLPYDGVGKCSSYFREQAVSDEQQIWWDHFRLNSAAKLK